MVLNHTSRDAGSWCPPAPRVEPTEANIQGATTCENTPPARSRHKGSRGRAPVALDRATARHRKAIPAAPEGNIQRPPNSQILNDFECGLAVVECHEPSWLHREVSPIAERPKIVTLQLEGLTPPSDPAISLAGSGMWICKCANGNLSERI